MVRHRSSMRLAVSRSPKSGPALADESREPEAREVVYARLKVNVSVAADDDVGNG